MAPQLWRLIESTLGSVPLRVRGWDGSEAGPAGAPVLVVRSPRALRRLVWSPDEVGLGRAYVSGDLEIEGDLSEAMRGYGAATAKLAEIPGSPLSKRQLLVTAVRLRALGPPPAPPLEEVRRLRGRRHSKSRDRVAVSHHYDVSNDFYRLVLGPSLVYSCAYWARPQDPSYPLEDAQWDKLELVCAKLGLRPGSRLLDVGCGWGSMALHAAREHGATVVGITLSGEQATLAAKRVAEAGLADQVEIRVQDYRDVHDGPYDAISSIGMAEHVGVEAYPEYVAALFGLLPEGGRLLNHQIASRPGRYVERRSFITTYVFPDGRVLPLSEQIAALEQAGFEVRDVEALREDYTPTLRSWVANLEAGWDAAVAATSPGRARVWRIYLAGAALEFAAGRLGVNQVLAVKPFADGRSSPDGALRWSRQ